MKWCYREFEVDTDPGRIDLDRISAFLRTTYWAQDRSVEEIIAAWANSHLVFGVYDMSPNHGQMGCARVVTDTRTFGWLADVFIDPAYRGQGLGKFLIQCIVGHPDCRDIRLFMLGTRDAHGLYTQYGWETPRFPERFLVRYGNPIS